LATSALAPSIGKFTAQFLGEIEIALEFGHLQSKLSYYGPSPLFPSAPNTFFAKSG
jgi:hypothetical protein